jgi:ATP/maltotriose-dependent transcriptional regulator MalT
MAQGGKEHKMLFDLRGRRKNVVKVVYALLAALMGISLFVAVGPFNIGELFNGSGGSVNAAEPFEEQAERIEVKLKKDPQDPELLLALTRAQLNAANAKVQVEPNGTRTYTSEGVQEYQRAGDSWSKYLNAVDEPSPNVAQLMAPAFITLAELAGNYDEAQANLEASADAQQIVAEQRPSLNSYSTLAYYTYFTGDYAAAEKAEAEAKKYAKTKAEEKAVETQLKPVSKRAHEYQNERKKAEKEEAAAEKAGGEAPSPESLEGNPLEGLGSGGLGG